MKGRLEHELRINNNIQEILKNSPKELEFFYYNIQISKEPTTCLEYIRKIYKFLIYTNKEIKDITNVDISRYFNSINYITKEEEIKRTSSSYRQGIWSALNQFFNFLYLSKQIENNPMRTISRPKSTDNVERLALSLNELNAILKAVNNDTKNKWKERDTLILFLFMNTGMRKTALSEINIEDINYNNNTLTVIDKRNKLQVYNITDEMKTTINIWLYKRSLILNGIKEDALFISAKKRRISEKMIYNIVKKYSFMGLGYSISPHKLRASFVSIYYEACGHDIKATSQAVGHSNVATTSLYIVKNNNARKEAIDFMSKNLLI